MQQDSTKVVALYSKSQEEVGRNQDGLLVETQTLSQLSRLVVYTTALCIELSTSQSHNLGKCVGVFGIFGTEKGVGAEVGERLV